MKNCPTAASSRIRRVGSRRSRARKVSTALQAYALLATSADKGAVRDKAMLDG